MSHDSRAGERHGAVLSRSHVDVAWIFDDLPEEIRQAFPEPQLCTDSSLRSLPPSTSSTGR